MRIKHNPFETFRVCSCLPLHDGTRSRWYPYKHYSSKSSALSAIKRYKEKQSLSDIGRRLVYRIDYIPSVYSNDYITIWEDQ